jgi:hypothetical protein
MGSYTVEIDGKAYEVDNVADEQEAAEIAMRSVKKPIHTWSAKPSGANAGGAKAFGSGALTGVMDTAGGPLASAGIIRDQLLKSFDPKGYTSDILGALGQLPSMIGAQAAEWLTGGKLPEGTQRGMATLASGGGVGDLQESLGLDYEPQNTGEKYLKTTGTMLPNAAFGPAGGARGLTGDVLGRLGNVVIPGVASEGAGQMAEAMGADPLWAAGARAAGAVVGGAASSSATRLGAERQLPRTQRVQQSAVRKFTAQAPQDADAMAAAAQERRAAGMNPALIDVVDESGRGVVRAAASRMTPARTQVQDFADTRAVDLPRRMSEQARTHLSDDPRTPREIGAELAEGRRTQADADYGAVRGETFEMAPETVQALRTPHGRDAIAEAVRRERDPDVRAALNRLATDALDAPSTPITVGMADRIARTLYGRAQAAARAGDNDLAATFTQLGDDVRNPARNAVEGYGQAVDNYAHESRLIGAAERGEDYLARDTDNFVADIAELPEEGLPLARATSRRAVERASGENVSAAPGVARRIATAPEVQARTRALLPEDEAQAFERAMALEEEAVQNARYVAPNQGSKTQGATQDALQVAGEGAAVIGNAATGNHVTAALGAAKLWLQGRGLNNREAEALAAMAIDPSRTDEAIRLIQQRLGPAGAQEFLQGAGRALLLAAPAATGAAPP